MFKSFDIMMIFRNYTVKFLANHVPRISRTSKGLNIYVPMEI